MNSMISIILLIVGVVLIAFGISAMDSFSSDVSNFFTGSPTDKAVWLLVGGVVLSIAGLFGVVRMKPRR